MKQWLLLRPLKRLWDCSRTRMEQLSSSPSATGVIYWNVDVHQPPLARNCWRLPFACVNLCRIMLISRSCCEPLTPRNASECLRKHMSAILFLHHPLFPLFTKHSDLTHAAYPCGVYRICKNTVECKCVLRYINGSVNKSNHMQVVEKTKLYLNPMWPTICHKHCTVWKEITSLGIVSHWLYTWSYNTWKRLFLVMEKKKMLSLSGHKTANAEKTSVVFSFPVHWPLFSLSDGMKAQSKNLLHWSSEISLSGKTRGKRKKKKSTVFFFLF